MLRVHRVEVIFWWFKVLGNLQGAHCEHHKALDGHKSDSYAHKAVDRPKTIYGVDSLLAWLGKNPAHFVQHNPAIHGDSAQTKGTVLLSIVSSS